jgi:hypothetical protein
MRLERTSPTEEALEFARGSGPEGIRAGRAAGVSAAAGSAAAAVALGGVAATGAIAGLPAGTSSALAGVVIGAAVGAVGSGAIGLAISHQHRDPERSTGAEHQAVCPRWALRGRQETSSRSRGEEGTGVRGRIV